MASHSDLAQVTFVGVMNHWGDHSVLHGDRDSYVNCRIGANRLTGPARIQFRRECRMRYYGKQDSGFWVEVMISKIDGSIETRKYRGVRLVSEAAGPDFRTAMIHATIMGSEEDESTEEN